MTNGAATAPSIRNARQAAVNVTKSSGLARVGNAVMVVVRESD